MVEGAGPCRVCSYLKLFVYDVDLLLTGRLVLNRIQGFAPARSPGSFLSGSSRTMSLVGVLHKTSRPRSEGAADSGSSVRRWAMTSCPVLLVVLTAQDHAAATPAAGQAGEGRVWGFEALRSCRVSSGWLRTMNLSWKTQINR